MIDVRLLEVLRAITRQLASTSDLAEVLSTVVNVVHRHLQYEQVAVYLTEPDSGELALCAVAGVPPVQIPASAYHLRLGTGTPGRAALSGKNVQVDDFSTDLELIPAWGQATTSELSVPIRDTDCIIGAFAVASSQPAQFGPADEQALALLAEQLAAAVRSAELFRREAEHVTRETLLTHISHAVNDSLSINLVLEQAVTEVGERLKVDRCTIGEVDIRARTLVTSHEYINPLMFERRRLTGQRPLAGPLELLARLEQSGQVVISTENNIHPLLADTWEELSGRYAIRSLVWVPIATQADESFYSLSLMQVTHPRRWTADDIALLRGIADQLALALRNARLFDAMQQAAVELRANNTELESFVYTVSHDLQAPVVSLRGFASLLQSRHGTQLDERGMMYVTRIAANAEFLNRLLQDLLELSRVGRLEEPDEAVSVEDVARQVLEDLARPLADRGVRLKLPPAWPVVRYSRPRLRQVFSNLISNAIKFLGPQTDPCVELGWRRLNGADGANSPVSGPGSNARRSGGPSAEFTVSEAELLRTGVGAASAEKGNSHWIEFSVKDNGIGIHPDYHQRIFGAFQRLKDVDVEGTGVGLSIVRRIVEGRGGTVRVESAPGAGATFHFTAPAASEARNPVSPRNRVSPETDL